MTREGNKYKFLYAWSDSKKLVKKFFKVRDKKKFDTVKISDIDIDIYQDEYSSFKLTKAKLHKGITPQRKKDDLYSIVLTEFEKESCENDIREAFYENICEEYKTGTSDYILLKSKYIEALSKLGYCQLYDMYIAEDDDRNMRAADLESYNIQSDIFNINSNRSVNSQMCSEFSAFIMQFSFTC